MATITTGKATDLITFSRASLATVTDADGKLKWAPHNLLLQSEQFDASSWTKTELTVSANQTVAPNGTTTADLLAETTTNAGHTTYPTTALSAGVSYVGGFYFKKGGGATAPDWVRLAFRAGAMTFAPWANFNINTGVVGNTSGAGVTAAISSVGSGWYLCTITATADATSANSGVYIQLVNNADTTTAPASVSYAGATTANVSVWGAHLYRSDLGGMKANTSAYPYYNPTTTAAYHGPRLDYDASTLAAKGLLVEEQRTNLCRRSEEFGTTWTLPSSAGTVTSNSAPAPSGATTADLLTETVSGQATVIRQTYSALANATHTFSTYVKLPASNPATWVMLQARGNAATVVRGWFNVSTGVKGSSANSPVDYTITSVGSGWYRVAIMFAGGTGSDTPLTDISIVSADSATTPTATTDKAILLWGAQLEAGAFATSYIPTTSASATRSADVASVGTSAFPYSATEGTLVVSAVPSSVGTAGLKSFASLSDGTANNRAYLFVESALTSVRTSVSSGGATQASISLGNATANTALKVSSAFAANNVNGALNGVAGTDDTVAVVPSAATTLHIGGNHVGGDPLNGWIRQITYLPRRLSNAELQARTA